MSTLTSILATDLVSDSRSTINTNFGNLNTNKVETSTLTGSYLTTSTITGSFPTFQQAITSIGTINTSPGAWFGVATIGVSGNTNGFVGLSTLPAAIMANNVTFSVSSVNAGGQYAMGWYNESGQKINSMITGSYNTNGQKTENISSVLLGPGNVYTIIVPISSVNGTFRGLSVTSAGAPSSVTGKNPYAGIIVVSANTLPNSFIPSAIPFGNPSMIAYRLDQ